MRMIIKFNLHSKRPHSACQVFFEGKKTEKSLFAKEQIEEEDPEPADQKDEPPSDQDKFERR